MEHRVEDQEVYTARFLALNADDGQRMPDMLKIYRGRFVAWTLAVGSTTADSKYLQMSLYNRDSDLPGSLSFIAVTTILPSGESSPFSFECSSPKKQSVNV